MKKQTLPFTVTVLKTAAQLDAVVAHRARGYGRRSAALGSALALPEPADARSHGREILVAQSKLDGAVIGSMRLHVNYREPTNVEKAASDLPASMAGSRIMDSSRFCCAAGHVCRGALFKAGLLYARRHKVDHFLLATLESIEPLYASVGFAPLFEDGRLHPIAIAENLPHRVMHLNMATLEEDVARRRPAMVEFLFETEHEDIDVSGSLGEDD
jgi:hypothetical protein